MPQVPVRSSRSDEVPAALRRKLDELARLAGLRIQRGTSVDFTALEQVARNSLCVPDWRMTIAENRQHYRPDYAFSNEFGELTVTAAENSRGQLAAYAYVQRRDGGDAYLKELAATPPNALDKVPFAGAIVFGVALVDALEEGALQATVNILQEHRLGIFAETFRGPFPDPVPYYQALSFAIAPHAKGYTDHTLQRRPVDTWMTADPLEVVRRIIALVTRKTLCLRN